MCAGLSTIFCCVLRVSRTLLLLRDFTEHLTNRDACSRDTDTRVSDSTFVFPLLGEPGDKGIYTHLAVGPHSVRTFQGVPTQSDRTVYVHFKVFPRSRTAQCAYVSRCSHAVGPHSVRTFQGVPTQHVRYLQNAAEDVTLLTCFEECPVRTSARAQTLRKRFRYFFQPRLMCVT